MFTHTLNLTAQEVCDQAISDGCDMDITYQAANKPNGASGDVTTRRITPIKWAEGYRGPMLVAKCHQRDDIRHFVPNRMIDFSQVAADSSAFADALASADAQANLEALTTRLNALGGSFTLRWQSNAGISLEAQASDVVDAMNKINAFLDR